MTVTIDNLAETFLGFWRSAKDKPIAEQAFLWKTHYAEPHRNVLNFYEAHYNDLNLPLEEVCSRYPGVISAIRTVSAGAEVALTASVGRCAALFGEARPSGRHIVMVGRFSSNAWADMFEGDPTCFYALELIPDLDTLALIAAHETAHTLHFGLSDLPADGKTVAETLIVEGLATLTSARITPGLEDEDYLWPGYETTTAGQKVAAWLAACKAQRPELNHQLLNDLEKTDSATLGRYFGAGSKYRHPQTPVRAGYAVGYWLVRDFCRHFELRDLVRWKRVRVGREVARALQSLT